MSKAQETVTIKNGGGIVNDRLSRDTEIGQLELQQRSIAQVAGCSRNTAEKVLRTASAKGVQWPLDDDITNADLEEMLFPGKYKSGRRYVEPDTRTSTGSWRNLG